ncbi:MAG: hypothetical protein QM691_01710 [Opitutaceae bacterium]
MHSSILDLAAAPRRFLQRLFVIALVTFGSVGPLGLPVARATQEQQAAIAATKAELAEVRAQLETARSELKQLLAQKPRPPAANATAAEKKRYESALADWQQKVDALKARIAGLQTRHKELQQRLNRLGGQPTGITPQHGG